MVDIVSTKKRSEMMSGIRGQDTLPEISIRKGLHKKGFRYRIHYSALPGKPDLVLPKYRAIIFVNGCFWHRHDCPLFRWPAARQGFWREKLQGNAERDQRNIAACLKRGWRVLIVWECALKGSRKIEFVDLLNRVEEWILSENPFAEFRGEAGKSKAH